MASPARATAGPPPAGLASVGRCLARSRAGSVALSLALLLALWWLASLAMGDPLILPGPAVVATVVVHNLTTVDTFGLTAQEHALVTFGRILVGFSAAFVFGAAIGILVGASSFAEKALGPYIALFLSIPGFCWAILSVLWLGLTEQTAYLTVFLSVFPFVTVNVHEGMKTFDRDVTEMAAAYRARPRQYLLDVYIPHLMPYLFAAARYSFANSWKVVALAELFGLQSGIGFMIRFYYDLFRMEQVLAWVVMFGGTIALMEVVVMLPLRRYVFRWKPQTQS